MGNLWRTWQKTGGQNGERKLRKKETKWGQLGLGGKQRDKKGANVVQKWIKTRDKKGEKR